MKVGDRVLFGKYSGQTVKVDGNELLVMKEDDLFAVIVEVSTPSPLCIPNSNSGVRSTWQQKT